MKHRVPFITCMICLSLACAARVQKVGGQDPASDGVVYSLPKLIAVVEEERAERLIHERELARWAGCFVEELACSGGRCASYGPRRRSLMVRFQTRPDADHVYRLETSWWRSAGSGIADAPAAAEVQRVGIQLAESDGLAGDLPDGLQGCPQKSPPPRARLLAKQIETLEDRRLMLLSGSSRVGTNDPQALAAMVAGTEREIARLRSAFFVVEDKIHHEIGVFPVESNGSIGSWGTADESNCISPLGQECMSDSDRLHLVVQYLRGQGEPQDRSIDPRGVPGMVYRVPLVAEVRISPPFAGEPRASLWYGQLLVPQAGKTRIAPWRPTGSAPLSIDPRTGEVAVAAGAAP